MANKYPNDRSQKPGPENPGASNAMRIRTLILVAAFLIFGFGLLVYQLYVLQIRDYETYRVDATEQQLSDTTIPSTRGSIYSSTGKLLAKSSVVWNIVADPSRCSAEYINQASEKIAELTGGAVTAESVASNLSMSDKKYRVLVRGVDMPTAEAILQYASDLNKQAETTVLYLYTEQSSTREYPYGAFLSSVLGFTDSSGAGTYGLEYYYNDILAGTPGRSVSLQSAGGVDLTDAESDYHAPIDGLNLNLCIDDNIQSIVEEYLQQAIVDYNVKSRACAIVMNVNTGEILAMASMNQFDPNDPNTIYDSEMQSILDSDTLTAEQIDTLVSRLGNTSTLQGIIEDGQISDDEYSTLQGMMREAQWKNKTITELYYPGSVFKLVTASAALDSGIMDTSQQFYCGKEGWTINKGSKLYEHTYHCAHNDVHGWQDMATALNNSCNIYFIQVGLSLGPQVFYDYYDAFGFTQRTGVDLPNETRWMIYHNEEELAQTEANLDSSSFGQAQTCTPLQMATAVAAVVNGGYLVTPHVVDTITDQSGNVVTSVDTTIRRQVISEEVSAEVRSMMEQVVGKGQDTSSGRNAYVAGYRIGGKSGTSENLGRDERADGDYYKQISFTAVLPIDDPEIEVFVMMDDPRWTNDYASQIVAPVVGNIISEVAPYLGLERDPEYDTGATVVVPDVVSRNNSWVNAQVEMNKKGLAHKLVEGTGTVVHQYPAAGTVVPVGSTVYLYTKSTTDTMVNVPNVVGKSGSFAVQMLSAAGINAQISGDENALVTSQSVAEGTSVAMGTVITIETAAPESSEPSSDSGTDTTSGDTADPDASSDSTATDGE